MSLKFSQITDGGAFAPSTDKIVTVRSGATDVLTSPGTVLTKNASDVTKSVVASVSGVITSGHIATFADAAGTVADGGALGTSAAQAASSVTGTVAAVSGGVTIGHVAVFSDTAGTIVDGGTPGSGFVPTSRTVNGHALSADVTVSASDITTGTLPVAQLPVATSSAKGIVQPDNSTITVSGGVISAASSSPTFVKGSGTASQTGSNSLVYGGGASDNGVADAVVIGHNAGVSGAFGTDSVAIGHAVSASSAGGDPTVCIGSTAATNGSGAVVVGYNSNASASKTVVIGSGITESTANAVTIGNSTNTVGVDGSGNLKLTGVTTSTGAGAGTLMNAPHAGDPVVYIPIKINGTVYKVPGWAV